MILPNPGVAAISMAVEVALAANRVWDLVAALARDLAEHLRSDLVEEPQWACVNSRISAFIDV